MIDLKLAAAFIGWTGTTFVAHYSIKRILVAALPGGAEVWKLRKKKCILFNLRPSCLHFPDIFATGCRSSHIFATKEGRLDK